MSLQKQGPTLALTNPEDAPVGRRCAGRGRTGMLGSLRGMIVALVALAGVVSVAGPVQAAPLTVGHVSVEVVSETTSIKAGTPFTVGTHFTMDPEWHIYWINAGDAGAATTIDFSLPQGASAGAIQWPHPHRLPVPGAVNYGYEKEVTFLNQITPPTDLTVGKAFPLKTHVTWLVCSLSTCIPGKADLEIAPKVGTGTPTADPAWTSAFATARAELPASSKDWTFSAETTADGYRLVATPTHAGVKFPKGDVFFFSRNESVVENSALQPVKQEDGKLLATLTRASLAADEPTALQGDWVATGGWGDSSPQAISVDAPVGAVGAGGDASGATAPVTAGGLALAVALALMGGLILNLMPCVFPVLGIKIMGFVHQSGQDKKRVMMHGLVFTAGVLISFWALAGLLAVLRLGGAQLGWGFQLQSPIFVFILTLVMLTFALNLSGVFEFGTSVTGVGSDLSHKSGLAGTFFTGFLATVVATPCSAPFLAPALSAALTLPLAASFLVFTAIGIGLSLPYLLLSIFPQAVKVLPRPGAWMETFKQAMAFPLYATVAYLVWVLAGQTGEDGLLNVGLGLTLFAGAAWAWGHWNKPGASQSSARFAAIALVILASAGAWVGWPRPVSQATTTTTAGVVWDKWSPEAVAALQAENRIIYVDFTARWCATCQVNKKVVFHSKDVLKTFADKKVAMLKGDWTNQDPAITAELAKYQRNAIPFNLVYKPGEAKPQILPEVLTPEIVLKAVS